MGSFRISPRTSLRTYEQGSGVPSWFGVDERFIAAHHQPALLIDLLCSRGLSSHKVLRATGLFYDDILAGDQWMSRMQLRQLIANARKLNPEPDLSFRWGAQYWPGHYGAFSHLLGNSDNLGQALKTLVRYRRILSPGLSPRLHWDDRYCYLQWLTLDKDADNQRFLLEASMAGVHGLCRWMTDEKYPWRFAFSHSEPDYPEQYQVHLGDALQFNLGADLMVIEKSWLNKPWPKASAIALNAASRECEQQAANWAADDLPSAVYGFLMYPSQAHLGQTEVAEAFGMSNATFKRKLSKHHCSFQSIHDQARLHTCLYLLHVKGWTNEQVAQHLDFHDTTNFRRAFKRWLGMTPSDSRNRLNWGTLATASS